MKYFFVAGEASGDLHTSTIMKELKGLDPSATFAFMGGPRMRAVGGRSVVASEAIAFMGFVDVALNLSKIQSAAKRVQQVILEMQPDVVVCTDYAGFCFRYILPFVRKHLPSCRIVYYIPPKVWAWKKGRIKTLRTHTDLVLSIFPFEVPYFEENHLPQVKYVGNPSLEEVEQFLERHSATEQAPYIALLPGSRKSEIIKNLPTMLRVAHAFPEYDIKIAGTDSVPRSLYSEVAPGLEPIFNDTYTILSGATAALVTSGTATLETALFGVPQVVCYAHQAGHLANFVFDRLFTAKYISLVNLIADEAVVPELFGGRFREDLIKSELSPLLRERGDRQHKREAMIEGYKKVHRLLQTDAPSSKIAAEAILGQL
ncbi:MAG: lipid-A-disaccharide synthase [Porphyromonas sp.]|nr:lipid-A-disaccharide synthase [Porphyromonas sp.]